MRRLSTLLLLTGCISIHADLIVKDPKSCPEAAGAQQLTLEEGPLRISLGDGGGSPACLAHDDKGETLRVWKYPHQYQRMASPKTWKIAVEKGDGDRNTYVLPANSVVGVFLQQRSGTDGKWKVYRGQSTSNPIALTQPAIAFNLDKKTDRGAGGLKQQFLVWDVLLTDTLDGTGGGNVSLPAGSEIRIESVWIWQGLNPLPKKLKIETGKAKISIVAE